MSKNAKKISNIEQQIEKLEAEMKLSLQKKAVGKAFDVPGCLKKIADLKKDLALLK